MGPKASAPGRLLQRIRHILGPLLLVAICPALVMLVWYTNVSLEGSVSKLFSLFARDGVFATLHAIWSPYFFGTPEAWKILAAFAALELFLMKALPGRKVRGPVTPKGNVPVYKANGITSFLLTMGLFYLGAFQ